MLDFQIIVKDENSSMANTNLYPMVEGCGLAEGGEKKTSRRNVISESEGN